MSVSKDKKTQDQPKSPLYKLLTQMMTYANTMQQGFFKKKDMLTDLKRKKKPAKIFFLKDISSYVKRRICAYLHAYRDYLQKYVQEIARTECCREK